MSSLRKGRVGTLDAVGESLQIGPIASVAFTSYLVASYGGAATPLVVLIALVGALALGWVFSQFGRRFAGAGTIYEYIALAGTRPLAVVAAGAFFLVNLIGAAGGLAIGVLIQHLCVTSFGFDPGWWSGALIAITFVTFVIYRDVRASTRTLLMLTAVASIPLFVLAGVILVTGGPDGHTLAVFDPSGGRVIQALLYGVTLFVGFEAAACLGEEARDPHRSIPRAFLISIATCGVFYLVMFYALTIGFGPGSVADTWGAGPLTVVELGDTIVGSPLSDLILIGLIVDLAAIVISIGNMLARGCFTLARDGLLPRALTATSPQGTPIAGIAIFAAANLLVVLAAAFVPDPSNVFSALFTAPPLISLLIYFVLCVLGVKLLASTPLPLRIAMLVAAAAVPVLGLYGSLVPIPEGDRLTGLLIAIGCVVAAAAATLFLRERRPEAIQAVGSNVRLAEPASDEARG